MHQFQFETQAPAQGMASVGTVRKQLYGGMSTSAFWRLRKENADFPPEINMGEGRRPTLDIPAVLRWIKSRQRVSKPSKANAVKRARKVNK
jgi:predicted DNA-binding transcriptional regulator AlpA